MGASRVIDVGRPPRALQSPAGFEAGPNHSLLIITPIFDDWTSARHLLIALERIACDWGMDAVDIVAVDDGSSQSSEFDPNVTDLTNIRQVTIVRLACNVGHQRAIAVGLSYAFRLNQHEYCLVMDSDGEDRPDDVLSLLRAAAINPEAIIVAKRARREESWSFRAFYVVYKRLFRVLTGREIDFGNFCLIPKSQLERIAHMTELWNHFAARLFDRAPLGSACQRRGARAIQAFLK